MILLLEVEISLDVNPALGKREHEYIFLLRDSAQHTNRPSPSGDPVAVNIAELGHQIKRLLAVKMDHHVHAFTRMSRRTDLAMNGADCRGKN